MPPPGWHALEPQGVAAAILGVTIAFSFLCTVIMILRVGVRLWLHMFALEDALMCTGYVINMVHNGVICYGAFTGLGTPDAKIPGGPGGVIYMEGSKTIFLWQVFFMSGFGFIKASICLTLLRIATTSWHRTVLWTLIGASAVSSTFVTIYVLAQCRPISASWGETKGTCAPATATVAITFVISALNLITDVTTAVLPFLMLRKVQMTRKRKTAVTMVLSLGVCASIATIARLPFGTAYFSQENFLVGLGQIILWTVVECDLALIAGSLPMLRALFKSLAKNTASSDRYEAGTELITIGRKGYQRHRNINTAITQLDDGSESTQHITDGQESGKSREGIVS